MAEEIAETSTHRAVVRKSTLHDQGCDDDYAHFTTEQRLLMVWPLTVTAWQFKDPDGIQQRLQRHVVRIERRER